MTARLLDNPAGLWPFPILDADADTQGRSRYGATTEAQPWVRLTDDHADDLLEAVPPIYFAGGFAVGEAHDSDPNTGDARYFAVVCVGDTAYGRILPRHLMATEARSLRDHLGV